MYYFYIIILAIWALYSFLIGIRRILVTMSHSILIKRVLKNPISIILFFWAIIQILLLMQYGIFDKIEALKYIIDANTILHEHRINEFRLFYSFYSSLVALSLFLSKSFILIIGIQYLLNGLATVLFYKILVRLTSLKTAFWASIVLIMSYPVQQWNSYIYTESIFTSGIIILIYLLLFLNFEKLKSAFYISLVFISLFFIRPSGVYLSIPLLVFVFINTNLFNKNKLALVYLTIVILALLFKSYTFYQQHLQDYTQEALSNLWVIFGYNKIAISASPDNYPQYILEILFKRFLYYFGMIRPYYGLTHNLYLMSYYPLYAFAVVGIFSKHKMPRNIKLVIILIVLTFSIVSIFTFINWHNRFIAPIIPLILIMSAIGFESVLIFYQRRHIR